MSGYPIVFVRGPRDGAESTVADLSDRLHVAPVVPPVATYMLAAADADAAVTTMPEHPVYRLAYAYGAPSRDDAGRYRYEYVGMRP